MVLPSVGMTGYRPFLDYLNLKTLDRNVSLNSEAYVAKKR